MLSTRDLPEKKRATKIESEEMEKILQANSKTYMTQNRFQNKGHKEKRQRRALHNN